MTENNQLKQLRAELGSLNEELLVLLNKRAATVEKVHRVKSQLGLSLFVPERERKMLNQLVSKNEGPFSDETVRHLFKEIFKASVHLMEKERQNKLLIARGEGSTDAVIQVGSATIGEQPVIMAGPCSIESREQLEEVAATLKRKGVQFMRGGAFKPRSSPYSFQGLGLDGMRLLAEVGHNHGLSVVSEVTDPRYVEAASEIVDMIQIGSRNMQNFELLREVGKCRTPVLLKRGLSATVNELMLAAEYIAVGGNEKIVFCERGIRTFVKETRFTLDISCVPLLRQETTLPVIVDVSHAAGRRDILSSLGRAAIAAGAQGLMVEVHPQPHLARSDGHQQLDLDDFLTFLDETGLATE